MSGLKPITVNTDPAAEAHIYAEDDAAIYQSIFGSDGVLTIGQQCESQVISNNKVRVKDGVIVVGGHIARIPHADYCDCEIANGQSGRNRNDIIIAKFVTTGSGGIDTYTLEVKQGAATTGDATDPALTQNNLYESGKIREMPLYRVKIEGLSIVGVEQMFEVVPTIPTLNAYLADSTTWKLHSQAQGSGKITPPDSYKELLIYTVSEALHVWSSNVPHGAPIGYIRSGCDTERVVWNYTETGIYAATCTVDGSNYISKTTTYLYYR